jgi:hypothetical protein
MSSSESMCTSIHYHQHKKEGAVVRVWMCHMDLMAYMTNQNNQVNKVEPNKCKSRVMTVIKPYYAYPFTAISIRYKLLLISEWISTHRVQWQ